ncbi:MAG: hypothetical protein KGI32_08445 [Gammaproteobacteria bacterium]|nr:hypothetical protein [Gammaproteobacteria bacterium]MDE2024753.1 hypothetical protein [Gammaproteobacteria bacterium]
MLAAWQASDRAQLFAEDYAQNHASPGQGAGYNADGSMQYVRTPNVELGAEFRQRLPASLGGWSHDFGAGLAVLY